MNNIRFSVHIPVYNVEKYLVECVESVLNQSYDNYEIILTDDGSTDRSGAVCDSFTDSRIKVFHNENRGLLLTRSFSIQNAKGEYSVFLDSDDYLNAGFLERINSVIKEENCDIVSFAYQRVYLNNIEKPELPWSEKKVFENENADEYKKETIFNNLLNPVWSKVIRTSLLRDDKTEFEKFNVVSGEDVLRSLYPVFNSKKIVFLPEYWYNYRQNEESITHTVNIDRYKSLLAVKKQAYSYFESSSFFNDQNRSRYYVKFIKSMMDCVKSTAASTADYQRKLQTFEGISADSFYKKMLKDMDRSVLPKKERIFLELFRKKQYRTIITVCRLFGR